MKNPETTVAEGPFWLEDWYVDPASGRISRAGTEVRLEPKVMAVLVLMARQPGEVLSREALEAQAWPGLVIGYEALATVVIKLRKALGDDSRNPRYLETIPKKGYRLIATVHQGDAPVSGSHHVGNPVPTRRWQTFGYLGVAILVMAVVLLTFFRNRVTDTDISLTRFGEPGAQATLVVLPFANRNQGPDQQYFSNGITDDLISDLSRYERLRVVARRSAYMYRQRQADIQTIARELGVDYVLDGDIRRDGNRIRMNVQLIDASSGVNLWARRFDRETRDIFQMQDDIRKNILGALSITLTQEEHNREQRRYTNDFVAYDLFLQGQAKLVTRASAADNDEARQLMEQAIEQDPKFARAHAALALIYADAYRFGWTRDPDSTRKTAITIGQHALELDDKSPEACWIMGYMYLFLSRDHERAIEMARRSLKFSPRNSDAITVMAVTYAFGDDPQRARLLTQELMKWNKHYSSLVPSVLGLANLRLSKYDEAIAAYDQSILINPSRIQSNVFKAVVLYRMGAIEDAEFQLAQLYSMHPDFDPRVWAGHQPFKDRQFVDHIASDLIKLGAKT